MDETYPIVGIDFGTSNSVCFIYTKGAWQCVKFGYQLFTPSCYSFRDGDEHYGAVAKNLMDKYPESVIYDMKRYIGKREYEFREMFDHFHYLFSLHENEKGRLYYSHPDSGGTNHRVFASAVVSKLYSFIIDEARKQLRQEVEYGVITVPAYFTDQQIEILKKAAQIAGLRQLDVIPEPTAAALAYQCDRPNSKLLIYDLGGGTFDVCILEVTIDGYKVIKCGGDPFLGGRDFDQRMLALIKKKLEGKGVDVNALTDSQLAYLQLQAEEAKIALSKDVTGTAVSLDESFGGIEVYIRKKEFENSIRDLIAHTCDLVEDYLDELDIELTDMDTIGLVGGSSQIPLVRTMLKERFPEAQISRQENTTTIVAKGACMRAFQQYCRKHDIPIPVDYQEKQINQFLNQPIFLRIGMNLEKPVLKQGSPFGREQRVMYRHASDCKRVKVTVLKGIREIGGFSLDVEKGKSVNLVVRASVDPSVRAKDKRVVIVRPNGGGEKKFLVNNWDDGEEEEMDETFEDMTVNPEVGPATEKEVELKSLEAAVEMWKGDRGVTWSSEERKKKAFEAIEKEVEEMKNNGKNEDAIHGYTLVLCGWHEKLVRSTTMLKEHIREHMAELLRERQRIAEGDSQSKKTILEYIDKRISDLNSGVFNSVSLEQFDKNSTNFMSWLRTYSFCVCFISPSCSFMSASVPKYDPIQGAIWKQGEPVPYKAVATLLSELEKISERNRMITLTANLFRSIIATTPEDLLPTVYLICNEVAPTFMGVELGIGDGLIIKAIQESTGKSSANIKAELKKCGDLGDIAITCKSKQKLLFPPPPLTVRSLYKDFRSIAEMEGSKSQDRKMGVIKRLMVAARGEEIKFIIRGLQGKLRVGLAEQSVICALAQAVLPPPVLDAAVTTNAAKLQSDLAEATETLKQVVSECPSYDLIVPALLQFPLAELHAHCHLTPGIPVQPMLAKPTKGISEVLDRLQGREFTCEYKYDGERAQVHKLPDGSIKIFSRNSEDNTNKYPDLVKTLHESIPEGVTTCILDSECVAWDREQNKILPFQVLSTRARKDVKEEDVKIHVVIFMFDILFLNGESVIQRPLKERRALLRSTIHEVPGRMQFATSRELADTEEIQEFLMESVNAGCEGLMVKTLTENATYEPSKRSLNWLKLKKDYLQDLGDSLDLVPIGGYYGKGKRTGNFGAFLLACYDVNSEEFQSVCKLGTGFSDEALHTHSAFFSGENVVEKKPVDYNVVPSMEPDVWFKPVQVWEVRAADLSISPVHTAAIGIVDAEKGIALRFPRFVRIREDKSAEEATSAEQVADFYNSQKIVNLWGVCWEEGYVE